MSWFISNPISAVKSDTPQDQWDIDQVVEWAFAVLDGKDPTVDASPVEDGAETAEFIYRFPNIPVSIGFSVAPLNWVVVDWVRSHPHL
jgi:hypothetical protein